MHYLLIGYGIVGRNLLNYLNSDVTVVESQAMPIRHPRVRQVIREKINEDNFERILRTYTQPGDIIIETAVEIDTYAVGQWAHSHGRHYINTVCDKWLSKTLFLTDNYQNINNLLYQYTQGPLSLTSVVRTGPTCLFGHGANIGMVNHFFKMAILEKARSSGEDTHRVLSAVKQVYILEKDTLLFKPGFVARHGTFYNTWNILEFLMESTALADYPANGEIYQSAQPEIRDVFLGDTCLHGRVVSHEETYTINEYLKNQGVLAEKIQFLYECSPVGELSRIKFPFGSTYTSKAATSELNPNAGFDLVAALVLFADGSNWFYGYRMTQDSIKHTADTNATAWFVSAGVLAGIHLIRSNPDLGINFPENLDFALNEQAVNYFLNYVTPDNLVSRPVDGLYLSGEYPTYDVPNLFAARHESCTAPAVLPREDPADISSGSIHFLTQ